jgi:hypothetical protein
VQGVSSMMILRLSGLFTVLGGLQLLIRESGRKQLQLGSLLLDIDEGVPLTHVFQIAAVQASSGSMALLGQATQRIVLQCAVDQPPNDEPM